MAAYLLENQASAHSSTILDTLHTWAEETPDIILISDQGALLQTHQVFLKLYSPLLNLALREIPPGIVPSIHIPASTASLVNLVRILSTGVTISEEKEDLLDVVSTAALMGIFLKGMQFGTRNIENKIKQLDDEESKSNSDENDTAEKKEEVQKIGSDDESSDFYFPPELETTPGKQEIKREEPSDTDDTQVSYDDEHKSADMISYELDVSNGCECKICGKRFLKKENLKRHLIVHSDDKPFTCTECEFKTKRKDKLNSHMKFKHTPSSAESVTCPECGKEFGQQSNLQRHLPIHSDERPFPCVECESRFKRKDKLKDHMNAKHNENNEMKDKKAFKCTVCNKGYGSSWYQKKHMQEVHAYSAEEL